MRKLWILLIGLPFLIYSCKSGSDGSINDEFVVPDSVINSKPLDFSQEALDDIVHNIASPVEMASIIWDAKAEFSRKILCETDLIEKFSTSTEKAFALGVYGADLGYINIYNKSTLVLDYISAIKELADAIKVGQFFDFSTLKDLALNSTNFDSLTYISVHSFNEIDNFLRENGRGNLSALTIVGAWVEGIYLATQIIKDKPNKEIAEKIGEQKLILNDVMLILENYSDQEYFAQLIKELNRMKTVLDEVKITYEKGEPTSVEKDGMLIIVQNETSIINISDELLLEIVMVTEDVRNSIMKVNEK